MDNNKPNQKIDILPASESILAELNLSSNIVKEMKRGEKRAYYRSIINWLTKYRTYSGASNLDKVKGLLETFCCLSDLEEWNKATKILCLELNINKTNIEDVSKNIVLEENYQNGVGISDKQLYSLLDRWGYYNEQINLIKQILYKVDNAQTDLILLYSLAISHRKLGEYNKAVEAFFTALSITQKIGSQSLKSCILNSLANVYRDLGNFEKSIEFHHQSLSICQEVSKKEQKTNLHLQALKGLIYGNLGNVYRDIEEYNLAFDFLNNYLNSCEQLNDTIGKSIALCDLGVTYGSQGEYKKAIEYYQKSLTIAEDCNDYRQQIFCKSNMGLSYGYIGDYDKAISLLDEALSWAKKSEDIKAQCNSFVYLGIVYYLSGNDRTAIEYYQLGLKTAQKIDSKIRQVNSLIGLGDCYYQQKSYQEAIDYYQQCLSLIESIQDKNYHKYQRLTIAKLGKVYSDLKDYDRSLKYLNKALEMCHQINNPVDTANVIKNFAYLYYQKKEIQLAQEYCEQALRIIREADEESENNYEIFKLFKYCESLQKEIANHDIEWAW